MQAGGGGQAACSASAPFSFSWANGSEEAIEAACPASALFSFSWANGTEEVRQSDFSVLSRPWPIPVSGDDGAEEAFPRALAMPVISSLSPLQSKPRSCAPENAVRCIRHRSALRQPMQRAAFFFSPWGGSSGCAFRPGPEAASSLLGMHSDELGTRLRWGTGRRKYFWQSYRKIPQKAVLWPKKWAGWLDLSQNLDKFAMIRTKKQKHEGKTFPRCAAQRSVSQATRHIPQTTKASGPEEVQQGREIPSE